MLRALRLQIGGGLPPPPPTLLFFKAGQACFKASKPMLQELRTHAARIVRLQMARAARPPTPPLCFCRQVFASTHTSPFRTHAVSIAFANGGGGCAPPPPIPPSPPLFVLFWPGGLVRAYVVPNPGFEHCVCKWGGLRSPQPPRSFFFMPGRLASKNASPFQTHVARIAFANGGGCPNPPLFFSGRQVLLQRIRVPSKPLLRALRLQMGGAAPPPAQPLFLNPQKKPPNPKP